MSGPPPPAPPLRGDAHLYACPHLHGVTPFRILGNLYYVGDDHVGIHLVDTGDGLLLLDSGYPEMQAWLIHNIWRLGFRPSDIRMIVHTHAHFDHLGATCLLKELSGAVLCIGAADAQMMRERPGLVFADCHPPCPACLFSPDVELQDNDTLTLGRTTLRVRAAPGHTPGTLAVFITVQDGSGTYIAGMHGGVGFNTLSRAYLNRHGLSGMREAFADGLTRLSSEHVDLLLGNHTAQTPLLADRARMAEDPGGPNPFLNPERWGQFLAGTSRAFARFLAEDP